ncbi:preprotein translocase subunit SecG, partial [bacterium]|nr:preprotein translocase subunit SecG [bacterium]
KLLTLAQLISSGVLIIFILLQAKGSGLGAAFGGEGNIYRTKRGLEKGLFILTIIVAIIFASSSFLAILLG